MFGNLNCFEVNGVAIKISPSLKNCTLQTELANAQRAENSHAEAALSSRAHMLAICLILGCFYDFLSQRFLSAALLLCRI